MASRGESESGYLTRRRPRADGACGRDGLQRDDPPRMRGGTQPDNRHEPGAVAAIAGALGNGKTSRGISALTFTPSKKLHPPAPPPRMFVGDMTAKYRERIR